MAVQVALEVLVGKAGRRAGLRLAVLFLALAAVVLVVMLFVGRP